MNRRSFLSPNTLVTIAPKQRCRESRPHEPELGPRDTVRARSPERLLRASLASGFVRLARVAGRLRKVLVRAAVQHSMADLRTPRLWGRTSRVRAGLLRPRAVSANADRYNGLCREEGGGITRKTCAIRRRSGDEIASFRCSRVVSSRGGGTRTHTPFQEPDFKSVASAIPPRPLWIAFKYSNYALRSMRSTQPGQREGSR